MKGMGAAYRACNQDENQSTRGESEEHDCVLDRVNDEKTANINNTNGPMEGDDVHVLLILAEGEPNHYLKLK